MAVTACEVVPDDWHARFSCVGRSYLYRISNRRAPLTLDANRVIGDQIEANLVIEHGEEHIAPHDFAGGFLGAEFGPALLLFVDHVEGFHPEGNPAEVDFGIHEFEVPVPREDAGVDHLGEWLDRRSFGRR